MGHPEFYNIISAHAHSRREYMFIGFYEEMSLIPEGNICKIARFLHTIPSGLAKILTNFPINIYSLREWIFAEIMLQNSG
jgi:hypothetical protein